jgi:hypothetical protein
MSLDPIRPAPQRPSLLQATCQSVEALHAPKSTSFDYAEYVQECEILAQKALSFVAQKLLRYHPLRETL